MEGKLRDKTQQHPQSIRHILVGAFVVSGMLWNVAPTHAATVQSLRATPTPATVQTFHVPAGQTKTVTLTFQNNGTTVWKNSGEHFTALNTVALGKHSIMQHTSWQTYYRPTKLKEASVAPKKNATFRFTIQAPKKTGIYTERFRLAVKGVDVVQGSIITVRIVVDPPASAYKGSVAAQSATSLTLQPGQSTSVWVDMKNTGSAPWKSGSANFVALNVTSPVGRTSPFTTSAWVAAYRPTKLIKQSIATNKTVRLTIPLTAPTTAGSYTETFQLVAENLTWIPGTLFTIPITVTGTPVTQSTGEPIIDVGIQASDAAQTITANGAMIVTQNGTVVATEPANGVVTLSYANGTYTAHGAAFTLTSSASYRVEPVGDGTILTATSFENRPGWNLSLNDNAFRGSLTYIHSTLTNKTWLINRLPLEQYVRGIAEAGNTSPTEYLKAQIIAARSYAHYHIRTNTKHDEEFYTVDATYDQVYRGYNFETRSPNVTAAVVATTGLEVTYNGTPVITPYYSHSDGRTRSWEEVWGGTTHPWCISVSVPEDSADGYTSLFGHGVGMSANGALTMAASEGKTYDQILAYFYTGTKVEKQY